ncbi:hypothetical protein Tco_0859893 [Tanacetum coccineum]|uniref:Uncharacterized protein n=1 Tax=Tanacetum coccineum TaxID=301880 RepID=A0ABQ5BE03_9ASTR
MSSDSVSSEVTYTFISSHGDPLAWTVDFFRLQEPDSPEAAPASPDYVPSHEEPKQAPLSPNYVSGPEYPEYLASSDEEVPVEVQPYVVIVIHDSLILQLGCLTRDPEEDSEDGPVDYPADGGNGDDDDSSDNDEEEEEEEEVERLLALPPPPPSPLILLSPHSIEERLARCLAAPTFPSSPLPIVPHPYGSPNYVRAPLGFRAAIGRLRASSPSTHHPLHPSSPLPPLPSSLHLPPHVPTSLPLPSSPLPPLPALLFIPPLVDRREDTPEAESPPRKRLCLTALTLRYKMGKSSTAAPRPTRGHGIDYGFIGTLDAETRRQRAKEVGYRIRDAWVDPTEAVEEDVYAVIEDTQDRQTQLFQRVDGLVEDGQFHYETARLLDQEALVSREAWAYSVGLSSAVHYELQAYRTHTQKQDFPTLGQIQALQARGQTHADNREGAGSSA